MKDDVTPGPTGAFPDGKIGPTDAGELNIGISDHKGLIIVRFDTPVAWMAIRPDEARELAMGILKRATEVDGVSFSVSFPS